MIAMRDGALLQVAEELMNEAAAMLLYQGALNTSLSQSFIKVKHPLSQGTHWSSVSPAEVLRCENAPRHRCCRRCRRKQNRTS